MKEENVANGDMFADYIEWRAEHPSDDLMTQLLNAEFEDEHGGSRTLTREEVLTYTAVIAGAGNETTGRLIGWLAQGAGRASRPAPRRRRGPLAGPERHRRDAALRADWPRHRPLRDARTSSTTARTVPAGSADAAARGVGQPRPAPVRRPDVFDIHREDIQHLTFGFGLHYCLGANLARLEGGSRSTSS